MGNANTRLVKKLVIAVFCMFGFGFALVPLYDVFCEVTGLNGKPDDEAYTPVEVKVDESRTITIQFIANNNDGMAWKFSPNDRTMKVHPGAAMNTSFFAENPTARHMLG